MTYKITNKTELETNINKLADSFKDLNKLKTQANSLLDIVTALNQKYADLPLFNVTITTTPKIEPQFNTIHRSYTNALHAELCEHDSLRISLNYQNFPLVTNLYLLDYQNDIFTHYFYAYDKISAKDISVTAMKGWSNNFNLLEHVYVLKAKINDLFKLVTVYQLNNSLMTYFTPFKDVSNEEILIQSAKELLTKDLYDVIFVILDLFNLDTFKLNQNFSNIYETNLSTWLSRLVHNNNKYLGDGIQNSYTYYLAQIGLNGPTKAKLITYENTNRDAQDYFLYNRKQKDLSARMLFDSIYLNHLYSFNNFTFFNEKKTIAPTDVFTYFLLHNHLSTLDGYNQKLELKDGLKHGSDVKMFFTNEDLELINENPDNILHSDFNFQLNLKYFKQAIDNKEALYKTMSYKSDGNNSIFHTSLSLNKQIEFIKTCYTNVNLTAINAYNENAVNKNLNLLTQLVSKNLNKLATLFPNNTIYTNNELTLDHKYFTQTTQTFLTINPMLNPALNHFKFHLMDDVPGTWSTPVYARKLINQSTNYVQLNNKTTLVSIFSAFFNQAKQKETIQNIDVFNAYIVFLFYVGNFLRFYGFKSTKYGFLTPVVNFTGLMYGNLYLPNYKEQNTPINNTDISNYADFYHQFATIFLKTFSSIDFVNAFVTFINNPINANKDEEEFLRELKQVNELNIDLAKFNINPTDPIYKQEQVMCDVINTFKTAFQGWNSMNVFSRLDSLLQQINRPLDTKTSINGTAYDIIKKFMLQVVQKMQEIDPSFSLVPINDYNNFMQQAENAQTDKQINPSVLDLNITTYTNIKKGRL